MENELFDKYVKESETTPKSISKSFWLNKAIQICKDDEKKEELIELEKNLESENCLSDFYKKLWFEDLEGLKETNTIEELLLEDSTLNWELFDYKNYPNEIESEGKQKDWKMERESLRFIQANMRVIHFYLINLDFPTFEKNYQHLSSYFDIFQNNFLLQSFLCNQNHFFFFTFLLKKKIYFSISLKVIKKKKALSAALMMTSNTESILGEIYAAKGEQYRPRKFGELLNSLQSKKVIEENYIFWINCLIGSPPGK